MFFTIKAIFKMKPNSKGFNKNQIIKLSVTSNPKYILPTEVYLAAHNFKRAEVLLPFKIYAKKRTKDRFTQKLSIKIHERYKIITTDIRRRLSIKDSINNILCTSDVDTAFYKVVDGRPLRPNMLIFKSLKESINKVVQAKYDIGIKKDCVLNIYVNHQNEMDIYDMSRKRLSEQVKYFDIFISEDYQKSMASLIKWEKLKCKVDSKINELQNLALEQFTLKSRLIGLEYQYSLQQKYGRFLYYLSPPSWRLNNRDFARSVEIEAKGFDFIDTNGEDTFTVIFERLRNICYGVQIKPALYFSHPNDLMDFFDFMEKQQLHYYTHVNHLTPYSKILKSGIKYLKESILQESKVVTTSIKRFQDLLIFSEERCLHLKGKFYKILYGMFYESVGALDVLKLQLHLEFCYKKILLEQPANIDIMSLAQSIEKFYLDYSNRLDSFQNKTVRSAMIKCVETERLKAKRANVAAKELRLFYRLEKELLRSHGIFTDPVYRPIKTKFMKNDNQGKSFKKNMTENKKQTLTEAQMEYLSLFTDWTENDDPALYLFSLNTEENSSDA